MVLEGKSPVIKSLDCSRIAASAVVIRGLGKLTALIDSRDELGAIDKGIL